MVITHAIKKYLSTFIHCEQGVALVEFATSVSLLLLLFFGGIEVSRYLSIVQKVGEAVSKAGEVVAQVDRSVTPSDQQTAAQITPMLYALKDIMYPYSYNPQDVPENGLVIVTDISGVSAGHAVINWQFCSGNAFLGASKIGSVKSVPADLSSFSGFTIAPGDEVIIAEIYYGYLPITSQKVVPAVTLYRNALYMLRAHTPLSDYNPPATNIPPYVQCPATS